MTVLIFPSNPTTGQTYSAPNGVLYLFDGVKWIVQTTTTTSSAITNSVQDRVAPMFVNAVTSGITFSYNSATNQLTANVTGAGTKGDKGDTGDRGLTGDRGPTGLTGQRGLTGAQGVSVTLQGTKALIADLPLTGNPGDGWIVTEGGGNLWFWNLTDSAWNNIGPIVGPQGDPGAKGDTGDRGLTGDKGDRGDKGDTGDKGDKGDRGDAGGAANTANTAFLGNEIYNALQNSLTITSDPQQMTASIRVPSEEQLANGDAVTITNTGNDWTFGTDGSLTGPASTDFTIKSSSTGNFVDPHRNLVLQGGETSGGEGGRVVINTNPANQNFQWTFGTDGTLTIPGDIYNATGINLRTDRGTVKFGNQPEPGNPNHFHIMRDENIQNNMDLFFGDDYNYVRQPGNYGNGSSWGLEVGARDITNGGNQYTWRFGTNGGLTLPAVSSLNGINAFTVASQPAFIPDLGNIVGVKTVDGNVYLQVLFTDSYLVSLLVPGIMINAEGFPYPVPVVDSRVDPDDNTKWLVRQTNFSATDYWQQGVNQTPTPLMAQAVPEYLQLGTLAVGAPAVGSGTKIYSDTEGGIGWTFGNDGNLILPGNSKLSPSGAGIDLIAGPDGYAELASNNANNYMWVDNSGAHIATNWTATSHTWAFGTDGTLTLPFTPNALDSFQPTATITSIPRNRGGNQTTVNQYDGYNGGTTYFLKTAYPNLITDVQVGAIVAASYVPSGTLVTNVVDADPDHWGIDYTTNGTPAGDTIFTNPRNGPANITLTATGGESGNNASFKFSSPNGSYSRLDMDGSYLDIASGNGVELVYEYQGQAQLGPNDTIASWVETTSGGVSVGGVTNTNYFGWLFRPNGTLEMPSDGTIKQNNSLTKTYISSVYLSPGNAVVWSGSFDYISSAKLVIQVECIEEQDPTGWHVQTCEAVIASRGYGNGVSGYGDPVMTVYGIVHTSVAPLMTFTVQRNLTTRFIEVVGTLTGTAGSTADLRIHSVEMTTRD